jgi:hypothetical protein
MGYENNLIKDSTNVLFLFNTTETEISEHNQKFGRPY